MCIFLKHLFPHYFLNSLKSRPLKMVVFIIFLFGDCVLSQMKEDFGIRTTLAIVSDCVYKPIISVVYFFFF